MENQEIIATASAENKESGDNPEKVSYSFRERILLLIALTIGILWDRLVFSDALWAQEPGIRISYPIFWLCYLVLFYVFYWKRLRGSFVTWYVGICAALMCVWNFIYPNSNNSYRGLTVIVIPCVLMAHAQYAAREYTLKDAGELAVAWLSGWVITPFSGIGACFGAIHGSIAGERRTNVGKVLIAIAILIPVLGVLIALLSGADLMFGYYIQKILRDFDFTSLIWHTFAVIVVFILFYSFLWNVGYGKKSSATAKVVNIDSIISVIILGSVILLYVVFFAVQFTYLFARAGLPSTMPSFAEYARQGFGQTVAVSAINLIIFGIFLQGGKKYIRIMLAALLGLTVLMLVSGALRLNLYIDAYGLTWLRLLSAWFIVYLAAVIVLCAVRMLRDKLPAVAIAAIILIGWFLVLGYINPDWIIWKYNTILGWA
jgi:hypothetical protein